jgi:hypothetical protein
MWTSPNMKPLPPDQNLPGRGKLVGIPLTKQQVRAQKALASARNRNEFGRSTAIGGVRASIRENLAQSMSQAQTMRRIKELSKRGTSVARMKRHGLREDEEEELLNEYECEERDLVSRREAVAKLGLAPPLPRSILHPGKPRKKKS